jgi:hypothetical protein
MTVTEFWYGILTIIGAQIIIQVANVIISNRKDKAQKPLIEAQGQGEISEAWERVANGYAKQIESLEKLEKENAELRPLVLKLALQEEAIKQTVRDKEDWKRYSQKLYKQLEELGQIPMPFRRLPSDGDSEKVKAVTQSEIDTNAKISN